MIVLKTDLPEFARFLRQEFQAKPMMRSGEEGELLRAVIGCHLVMALEFNDQKADVWCSDENWLPEINAQWVAFREFVS